MINEKKEHHSYYILKSGLPMTTVTIYNNLSIMIRLRFMSLNNFHLNLILLIVDEEN